MRKKWVWVWMSLALLSLMAGMLLGCGTSSTTNSTRFLFAADYTNSRVLIYNVPFSTNQAAGVMLGGPYQTAASVEPPISVAVDASGNLYVGQASIGAVKACRVTQFQPPFSSGMSASLVLGEPDFATGSCVVSASGLTAPGAMAFDAGGNLWVTDFNRVVQFQKPFSNGMAAGVVLGQVDFTSSSCNQGAAAPTAGLVCQPGGLALDRQGNLWLADSGNNRVLQFRPPFTTGMTASLVLGQADFTGSLCNRDSNASAPATAGTLCSPKGLVFDSQGNLWLADTGNNRALQFSPPFTSGMAAGLVLGQQNFTNNAAPAAPAATTLKNPGSVALDSGGRLIVTDILYNRLLIFAPPFSNGMAASLVIGQPDFTHGDPNQGGGLTFTASTLYWPVGVATW